MANLRLRAAEHQFVLPAVNKLPSVWADPGRLDEMLTNLLENAAKYSPAGGQITVALEMAGDQVVTSIHDQGIGIPPYELDNVFDKYHSRRMNGAVGNIKVLLADDDSRLRSALRLLIDCEPALSGVDEAVEMQALFETVKSACPNVLLLDWELPVSQASDPRAKLHQEAWEGLLPILRATYPDLYVIVLSARPGVRRIALAAGAVAFASKVNSPDELLTILRTIDFDAHDTE